jgi:hypothetical protein
VCERERDRERERERESEREREKEKEKERARERERKREKVNDVKRHEESDDVFGKTKKIWKILTTKMVSE